MTLYDNRPQRQPLDPRGIRWWDPANLVLAIWLFISPWVLQFGANAPVAPPVQGAASVAAVSAAAWNAWVLGVIVFLVALSAMGRLARGQEMLNLLLGIWIFIAPWVLGFAAGTYAAAAWDHWIVGALIFLVSAASLMSLRRQRAGVVRTETLNEAEARQSLRR